MSNTPSSTALELGDAVGLIRVALTDPAAMLEVVNSLDLLEARLMIAKLVPLVHIAKTIGTDLDIDEWCEHVRTNVLKLG